MEQISQLTGLKKQRQEINSQIKALELSSNKSTIVDDVRILSGSHSGTSKFSEAYLKHRADRALCGLAPIGIGKSPPSQPSA